MSQRPWLDVAVKAALIGCAVLMYVDLRAEMRSIRFEINSLESKIDSFETRLEAKIDNVETRLEAKIDNVETKVDEMSGYFRYFADAMRNEAPPAEPKE